MRLAVVRAGGRRGRSGPDFTDMAKRTGDIGTGQGGAPDEQLDQTQGSQTGNDIDTLPEP